MNFDLEVLQARHEYLLRHKLPTQQIDRESQLYRNLMAGGKYEPVFEPMTDEYRQQDYDARHCMDRNDGYDEERMLDDRQRARDMRDA